MNLFIKVVKEHYADFKGRARRKEYWIFFLFNFIFGIIASIIDSFLGLKFSEQIPYGWIFLLFSLIMFLPNLSVSVRRLHDIGKSGFWILICFIPIIGIFIFLFFMILDSAPGKNKWGENPKDIGNYSDIDQIGNNEQ